MKKTFVPLFASIFFVAASAFIYFDGDGSGGFLMERSKGEKAGEKLMRAKEAMEHRFNRLKDENGNFYSGYYNDAVKYADIQLRNASRAGALGLQWEELGPDNVGGRTRALLIDKRDPSGNTIYAGGVAGGMWKSTDGANTWSRLNWNEWLTISCIDQDKNGKIYIGTGEGLAQVGASSFNSGNMGNGIYYLDNRDSVYHLSATNSTTTAIVATSPWAAVNRIACDPTNPDRIIAATQNGFYRTEDAGSTWNIVQVPGVSPQSYAADIKWSKDGNSVYASYGQFSTIRFIRSQNSGFQFEVVSNVNTPTFPAVAGRIEIAIAPTDGSTVYLSVAKSNGATDKVLKTTDGGDTWSIIGVKGPLFDPFGEQSQGWYDNTIAVSPGDPNKVYLGGVDFYTWNNLAGWRLADVGLGGGNSNPNYIHPDKHAIAIDPNNPQIMYVGCDGGVYKSINAVSAFPFPTYTIKNRGYNVTQFYSIGAGISGDVIGGAQDNGTSYIDFTGNTRLAAKAVLGGDGVYADISHINPKVLFGGIYFGKYYRSGNGGSGFSGFYDLKIDQQGFGVPSRCGGQAEGNASFISPAWLFETTTAANGLKRVNYIADRNYDYNDIISDNPSITATSPVGPYNFQYPLSQYVSVGQNISAGDTLSIPDPIRSRYFVTSNCGMWVTPDALNLSIIPRWFKVVQGSPNGYMNSLAQSKDGNTVYIGTSSGRVYKCNNFNATIDTAIYRSGSNSSDVTNLYTTSTVVLSSPTSRSIEGIAVDPNNSEHVAIALAGFSAAANTPHVYETTNGGASWTPLLNGLPNMPVYDVVISSIDGHIIVGSELGVWSWDGAEWHEENDAFLNQGGSGLPRVPVYRLRELQLYNESCPVLYIGTHGRGFWRSTTLLNGSACNTVANIQTAVKNDIQLNELNLYPNPVTSNAKISVTIDKPSDITFRVFDMTGKLYKEFTQRNANAGENKFDFDASGLTNGTYIIAATINNKRSLSRLFTVAK
jgi:photosystem II stability/assembly factor-like uncharacterized protein